MRQRFSRWLAAQLMRRAERRPYWHLAGYMERYWLLGGSYRDDRPVQQRGWAGSRLDRWIGRWLAVRVHKILRSDLDRHLHDHPCACMSVVLVGTYDEVLPGHPNQSPALDATRQRVLSRRPGAVVFRRAKTRHRLILPEDQPVWSLFILGAKSNEWGFYTRTGKVPWRRYLRMSSGGAVNVTT